MITGKGTIIKYMSN